MKKTQKITLCGITAALSAVCMLFSYFPYLTYAIPAASGLFMMVPVVEINRKWAFLSFLTASVAIFLFAEPESKWMYLCFLGYYPILKSLVEQLHSRTLQWILKLLCFHLAVVAVYAVLLKAFGVSTEDFDALGKYGELVILLVGTFVFLVYDVALSRMAALYMVRLHPQIGKLMRKG